MRGAIPLAVALIAALVPVRAEADYLRSTYGGGFADVDHRVDIARSGQRVIYTVRRSFENRSGGPDELVLTINLPTAAVADRFRHRMAGAWQRGTLMNASKASGLYDELTGSGPPRRRGPAVLSRGPDGTLELRAYPVAAGGRLTVEYRLTAPLCYRGGQYIADYPVGPEQRDVATPVLRGARVVSAKELLALTGASDIGSLCQGIGFTAGDHRRFAVWPASDLAEPARARLSHVAVDGGHHLVRVDLAVPPVIAAAPRQPRLVFAIDASRSQGVGGIATQLDLVRGYLAHLPAARVEIVVYRRWASRLLGRFVPAGQLDEHLQAVHAHRLAPGNGSHLDNGLGLAAHLLGGHAGPSRIIAFTDSRLRNGFDVDRAVGLVAAAPARTVLHIVDVAGVPRGYDWSRDDDSPLTRIARSRGGVVADVTGGGNDATAAMLGLVRPLTIDNVALALPGVSAEQAALPEVLAGGAGYRDIWLTDTPPAGAVISGWIWGRPWRVSLVPDRTPAEQLLGFAFAHPVERSFPDQHRYRLAMRAGVVSYATSFLSRDPAAGPTSHDPMGIRGISAVCGCWGPPGLIGRGSYGTIGSMGAFDPTDRDAHWRGLIGGSASQCALATGSSLTGVSITADTTGPEIVDLRITGADGDFRACLEREGWAVELPATIFDRHRGSYTARF